jgi:hypothetical protein
MLGQGHVNRLGVPPGTTEAAAFHSYLPGLDRGLAVTGPAKVLGYFQPFLRGEEAGRHENAA